MIKSCGKWHGISAEIRRSIVFTLQKLSYVFSSLFFCCCCVGEGGNIKTRHVVRGFLFFFSFVVVVELLKIQ